MKAQSEIVGLVTVLTISIVLVSTAYFWGMPLIEKRQDSIKAERVREMFDVNNFNSFPSLIERVIRTGNFEIFSSKVDGVWRVNKSENSVSFEFTSKSTNIANDIWVSIYDACNNNGICSNNYGILGVQKPFCICATSRVVGDRYLIIYKVSFRNLNSTSNEIFSHSVNSNLENVNLKNVKIEKSTSGNNILIQLTFQ